MIFSQSSGDDSIFIGVENNEEFNAKKANGNSRYEEDLPRDFQNVSRRNSLVNDSRPEPVHPPPPPQQSAKRPAPPVLFLNLDDSVRSEEDDDSGSNLSFGDVTMTAI
jgi:hypothetical protein